jgi:putative ubiquitin-RnfH superfamily antitoxin RatB of RatAB toxin-antitoxin module
MSDVSRDAGAQAHRADTDVARHIRIEVAYALPQRQELIALSLPEGSTLQQAVECSGLLEKYPDLVLARAKTGIYGKLSKADTVLRDRDRVEIYRPLIADPKEVRKQRAAEGKVMKKGGGEE